MNTSKPSAHSQQSGLMPVLGLIGSVMVTIAGGLIISNAAFTQQTFSYATSSPTDPMANASN